MTEHPIFSHVRSLAKKSYEEYCYEIELFLRQCLIDNPDYYIDQTWYTVRSHADEGYNPLYKVTLSYRFDPSKQIEIFKND